MAILSVRGRVTTLGISRWGERYSYKTIERFFDKKINFARSHRSKILKKPPKPNLKEVGMDKYVIPIMSPLHNPTSPNNPSFKVKK